MKISIWNYDNGNNFKLESDRWEDVAKHLNDCHFSDPKAEKEYLYVYYEFKEPSTSVKEVLEKASEVFKPLNYKVYFALERTDFGMDDSVENGFFVVDDKGIIDNFMTFDRFFGVLEGLELAKKLNKSAKE